MKVTANENKILQCNILKGDIFITPSSEVLNDIGNSAVVLEDLEGVVYSYHIMRIRLTVPNITTSMFIGYIFESNFIQNQINKNAKGMTRFGLTKTQWEKIKVPVPPLPVQEEIVRILDNFTELEAELEAELTARKKQYEYYREQLLSSSENTEFMSLSELVIIKRGVRVIKNQLIENGSYPVYQNSLKPLGFYDKGNYKGNTTYIITAGAAGEIGYSNIDFWAADDCFCLICSNNLESKYLYYVLKSQQEFLFSKVRRASIPRLSRSVIEKIQIPIHPLVEQKRIVSILDKFDTLVNDISIGLPAELKARRQQYEYYRNQLLTFKEISN